MLKQALNIGCGSHSAPGWINLDNSPNARLSKIPHLRLILYKIGLLSKQHYEVQWPPNLLVRDLSKTLPFKNNELKYIYYAN